MIPEIDPKVFAPAHAEGALVVDVRYAYEYATGHLPGALLMPLSQLHRRLAEVAKSATAYVICESNNRSMVRVHCADAGISLDSAAEVAA